MYKRQFRGVNKEELKKQLEVLSRFLEKAGYKTFVFFRDIEKWEEGKFLPGEVVKQTFERIKECDILLCLINHQEQSEGMLLEIGFAKALNKRLILLVAKEISAPTLEAISGQIIRFKNKNE